MGWVITEVTQIDTGVTLGHELIHGQFRIEYLAGTDTQPPLRHPFLVQRTVDAPLQGFLSDPRLHIGEETARHRGVGVHVHAQVRDGKQVLAMREIQTDEGLPTLGKQTIGDALVLLNAHDVLGTHHPLRYPRRLVMVEILRHQFRHLRRVTLGLVDPTVIRGMLHNEAQHGVYFPTQALLSQDDLLVGFPRIGLQAQRQTAVTLERWHSRTGGIGQFIQQVAVQSVQLLNERTALNSARRRRGERQRLTTGTHRRLDDIDETQHVTLAVGVTGTAELVGTQQLSEHAVLRLAARTQRTHTAVAHALELVLPVNHGLRATDALAAVQLRHQLAGAVEQQRALAARVGGTIALGVIVLKKEKYQLNEGGQARLVRLTRSEVGEVGAQTPVVPDDAVALFLRRQQFRLHADIDFGVHPRHRTEHTGQDEHLERLPPVHLRATRSRALQTATDIPPRAPVQTPYALAQTNHRLHLLVVEVVSRQQPQELHTAQHLIQIVQVIRILRVSTGVRRQVVKIHQQTLVNRPQSLTRTGQPLTQHSQRPRLPFHPFVILHRFL